MEQPNHKKRRNQSFFNSITETTLDQLNLWWGKETTEPRVEQARNQNAQWMNRKNQRNERSTAKEMRKTIGGNKHHRRVDCGRRIAGVGGSAGAEASAVWGVIGERERGRESTGFRGKKGTVGWFPSVRLYRKSVGPVPRDWKWYVLRSSYIFARHFICFYVL